jgi:hypothetical protein
MYLFNRNDIERLYFNGLPSETGKDHFPVVKLFRPNSNDIWLFSELNPNNTLQFWGLSGQGLWSMSVGYTDYRELISRKKYPDNRVERDPYFSPRFPMSVYVSAAFAVGFVTELDPVLERHRRLLRPPQFPN